MSDATPTPDIFADNSTWHEELDRLVNKDMDMLNAPEGIWRYTLLFQLIVQRSNDRLNREYTIAINAKRELDADPSLEDLLRNAWKSKSYRQIRNLGESILNPLRPLKRDDRKIVVRNNTNEDARYISLIWSTLACSLTTDVFTRLESLSKPVVTASFHSELSWKGHWWIHWISGEK